MVCIKTDAPKRFGNIVSQIQNASLQRLVSDNARIAAVSKAAAEVKLKQLQAAAKTLSTEVSNDLDQEHFVASELDILKTKDVVLQNQGGRIKQEIAKMQPLVKNGVLGVHNNSTALTMMIQNNQVAQEQQQLFNIEMERSVALPKEQADLLNQLKSLKRRVADLSSQIATNSAQIELARTTLKALQTTHVVRPSSPSIEPVGPGKSVFIILGAFMGLFLSVFYALLAHALASKKDELQMNVF